MKKGFTLITLLAVVGVLVVNAMVAFAPSYNSLKISRSINSTGIATIERVIREVRSARSIDTTRSVFDSPNGKLVISAPTSKVEMYLSNGRVYVKEGSAEPSPITKKDVTVTSLLFKHIDGPESETIQVNLTIEGKGRSIEKAETFRSAVVLRNLYSLGVAYFEGSYYSQGYYYGQGYYYNQGYYYTQGYYYSQGYYAPGGGGGDREGLWRWFRFY